MINQHHFFMNLALGQAMLAQNAQEIPVGAVLVNERGLVVASGYNRVIANNDPTAHAEIICIRDAAEKIANYRLERMSLYTTLEPCHMCMGAILHSRINHLIYATHEPKLGAYQSMDNLLERLSGYRGIEQVTSGICADAAAKLLIDFFKAKRAAKNKLIPS